MRTTWNYWIIFIVLTGAVAGWAQSGNVPPLNPPSSPPWFNADQVPPGTTPTPSQPTAPGGAPDGSFFVPPQPSPPGFDYFGEDDEDFEGWQGNSGRSGGGSTGEGKSSFMLVSPPSQSTCQKWGHTFLGTATFTYKASCESELSRKVDKGRTAMGEIDDKAELFKLRQVARRNLERSEADRFKLSFDSLKNVLRDALRTGCVCKD